MSSKGRNTTSAAVTKSAQPHADTVVVEASTPAATIVRKPSEYKLGKLSLTRMTRDVGIPRTPKVLLHETEAQIAEFATIFLADCAMSVNNGHKKTISPKHVRCAATRLGYIMVGFHAITGLKGKKKAKKAAKKEALAAAAAEVATTLATQD